MKSTYLRTNRALFVFALGLLLSVPACTFTMDNKNSGKKKEIYTLGKWTVKPGLEDEFIKEWTTFANWTAKNVPGTGTGYLLRDENNPLKFISFGPWTDKDAIQQWRERDEFKKFFAKARELCDELEPNTLRLVSSSE